MHMAPRDSTPRRRPGRLSAGFTLFELVIAIVLVAVFGGILLGRFHTYQEMAEKAAMEQTAGAVRSALAIQAAGLLARGKVDELHKLAGLNPMVLLTDAQKNYIGEFYDVTSGDITRGSWYYDLKRRELVYVVRNGMHFEPDENGNKVVRFKVGLVYNDWQKASNAETLEVAGIVLKEVRPYSWDIR